MRIPQIFIKVADWFSNESVTNNWLTAVGEGVSTYVGGPAFAATQTNQQTLTGEQAIIFNSVDFDLDPKHCYDTNTGRFKPRVAGYYLATATVGVPYIYKVVLYKNGTPFKTGFIAPPTQNTVNSGSVTAYVYMNGTTDYLQVYAAQGNATPQNTLAPDQPNGQFSQYNWYTHFSCSLVRPA